MSHATVEDYAWQHGWEEIYTVTFVLGLDERETLRRFGVAEQDMRPYSWEELWERVEETDGCCDVVVAARAGDWTIAFELRGWEGVRWVTLRELSRGGEAVAVMRHDYAASHRFMHAVDGEVRTGFRPQWPQERWGTRPDALNGHMAELGLPTEPEDELDTWDEVVPASLALAGRISGVLFDTEVLGEPMFGGIITAPVPDDPPTGDPLAGHPLRGHDAELAEAIDAADPGVRRVAVIAEARRLCRVAGVEEHPVLAEALGRAQRGESADERGLDRLVRLWEADLTGQPIDRETGEWIADPCAESHRSPGGRYSVTFVDSRTGERTCPTCTSWRRPSGEERDRARARWRAATAVRDTFLPDERRAAYDVHLTAAATDPEHAAAVVRVLRGEGH
ncbi:DUF6461 domain-containing protein [Nonomuraea rubra]